MSKIDSVRARARAPRKNAPTATRRRRSEVVGGFVLAEGTAAGAQRPASRATVHAAVNRLQGLALPHEEVLLDELDRIAVRTGTRSSMRGRRRLRRLIRSLVETPLVERSAAGNTHIDIATTWGKVRKDDDAAIRRLVRTSQRNLGNRDLMLRRTDDVKRGLRATRLVAAAQVALTYALSFAVPLLVLMALFTVGLDISGVVYWVLVATLGGAAAMQFAEASHAIKPPTLPAAPEQAAPRATAIVAAYLPNEAATIIETLQHFLAQQYSGGLQVILAYNTPKPHPIEAKLRALAAANPSLTLIATPNSTSKAQNVNAALGAVEGEFVGIFDADHHPMAGAFERAWRWIASGVDIVQGHCVVRNGDESFIAAMTSVEFEQIYAVSHPGRQMLHGFGIFGGSNGFWRASVLREIRMRGFFLTEDIEASIRSVREGRKIVNDPGLVSRELAPSTLSQLTKQRLRWAQGWFQVTLNHLHSSWMPYGRMSGKQRGGLVILLGWREAFLWLTGLMPAVLVFFIWRDGSFAPTSTFLWLTTLFTLSSGPIQVYFAHRLGAPEITKHRGRWIAYVFYSVLFYQEYKNVLGRLAQIKHMCGQRQWAVTPRSKKVAAAPALQHSPATRAAA